MNRGRLVQLGTPYELYHTPADQFVAEFVGLSNIVPVQVVEDDARGTVVQYLGRTLPGLRHPQGAAASTGATPSGKSAIAAVLRPEALKLHNGAGISGPDQIPARVQTFAFLGALIRYTVIVEDASSPAQELTIDLHNPQPDQFYAPGSLVHIQLPTEGVALLH
jgi:ABC-type Fe3+/spermidine/putrescine transport system ATPase subunit